ncbi:hypothetical protein HK096_001817, partial [Nowakowskiella sp. JEL0078]
MGDLSPLVSNTFNLHSEREEFATSEDVVNSLIGKLEFYSTNEKDEISLIWSALIFKSFAEAAKIENARQPLAESGVLKFIPLFLDNLNDCGVKHSIKNEIQEQVLRMVANLCYNHEQSRDLILETEGAIRSLVDCLDSSDISVLSKACGSLLNLSMDNEPVQSSILTH